MRDGVKSFGEINGYSHCSSRGGLSIKPFCYFSGQGEEGGGGGVGGFEAMLSRKGRKMRY